MVAFNPGFPYLGALAVGRINRERSGFGNAEKHPDEPVILEALHSVHILHFCPVDIFGKKKVKKILIDGFRHRVRLSARMSEFGDFIKRMIEESGLPNYEFASRMGLDPAHLSRFVSGKSQGVNVRTLARMVTGISSDPNVQAGLLQSYFRDQTLPHIRNWIRVVPANRTKDEEAAGYAAGKSDDPVDKICELLRRMSLPTPVIGALHIIIQACPTHPSLQNLVDELANFTNEVMVGRSAEHRVLYEEIASPAARVKESSKSSAGAKRNRRRGNKATSRGAG